MNASRFRLFFPRLPVVFPLLAACLVLAGSACRADDTAPAAPTAAATADGDKAWREAVNAAKAPSPPAEWNARKPGSGEVAEYYLPRIIKAANVQKDFYTRFPSHPHAAQARDKEYELLKIAADQFGDPRQEARIAAIEAERISDPKISADERYAMRVRAAGRLLSTDKAADAEKSARALLKDFPDKPEAYEMLLVLAGNAEPEKGRALLKELAGGSAPPEVKTQAAVQLKQMEAVGKPLNIQYTALDGRKVDTTQMKGKVVLVDFWATWCGPCVAELPHVKEAYEKLHEKGFEIVGVSFDEDKEALEKFVLKEKMAWPQYFDGKGWENKFGTEFGIHAIPAMWLIDKKGNLRDANARGGLEEKVTRLLAE